MHHQVFPVASRTNAGIPSRRAYEARRLKSAMARSFIHGPLLHPLSWWRCRPADSFARIDVVIARHVLTRTGIIGEPYWHLAAAGDATVAIAVALRVQRRGGSPLLLDVAMTAVLCAALTGNVPAALLIAALVLREPEDAAKAMTISSSWLISSARCAPRPLAWPSPPHLHHHWTAILQGWTAANATRAPARRTSGLYWSMRIRFPTRASGSSSIPMLC